MGSSSDDYCSSMSISTALASANCIERKIWRETCMRVTSNCISPRWIFSRWFHSSAAEKKGVEKVNHDQLLHKNRRKKKVSSSPSLSLQDSGDHKKADSFNLGIGFGLIYLFSATKNELNKIVEIRSEMEILLQNSKLELRKQERIRRSLFNSIAKCNSDCVNSEITCSLHEHCKMKGNEKNMEMNQLEAELEVELERLQFHLDSPVMLKYPTQQNAEIMVDYSSWEGSLSSSFGEVYNPNSYVTGIENCGVPPEKLSRRLHELIEIRQEERIKELESALESTMQKLEEKEREVRWRRDTTKVISACSKPSSHSTLGQNLHQP